MDEDRFNSTNINDKVSLVGFPIDKAFAFVSTKNRDLLLTTIVIAIVSLACYIEPLSFLLLSMSVAIATVFQDSFEKSLSFFMGIGAPLLFVGVHINQLVDACKTGDLWLILAVIGTAVVIFYFLYKALNRWLAEVNVIN